MHKGIWMIPQGSGTGQQIRSVRLPAGETSDGLHLGRYDVGSDTYVEVDAKWGWAYPDDGVTVLRWARACPDPASADVVVVLYKNPGGTSPTDNDDILKFTVGATPSAGGQFTLSWDFVVQYDNQTGGADPGGRSTGTVLTLGSDYTWSGGVLSIPTDWVSPHQTAPYGSFKITPKVTRTFDNTIPSPEFDDYQLSSSQVTGTLYRYVDPRADI